MVPFVASVVSGPKDAAKLLLSDELSVMLLEEPDSLEPIIGDVHEHSESVRVRDVVKNNLENLPFLLINTNLIMICIIKGNYIRMHFYSPFTGSKQGMSRSAGMHFYSPYIMFVIIYNPWLRQGFHEFIIIMSL